MNTFDQCWTKYLEQNKEVQCIFDIYFCVVFDSYCQSFIFGEEIEQ